MSGSLNTGIRILSVREKSETYNEREKNRTIPGNSPRSDGTMRSK